MLFRLSVFQFVWMFFASFAVAQDIRGRVLHGITGEPLPFVTVAVEGSGRGTFSDIDGYFRLSDVFPETVLTLSCLGFEPLKYRAGQERKPVLSLVPRAIAIREAVIVAGENPADIVMRKVIRNRERNNPEKNRAFTYESYNKLVVGAAMDSSQIPPASSSAAGRDSLEKISEFFKDKHLFLLESASSRKHFPPDRDEEVVTASRVSGLKNPQFALLGTQLQSFTLYGQTVNIMDLSYLSPIATEAVSKYLFILEDSTVMERDTVYTISFRPRRNTNFKGMTGRLTVSSDGWAVKNVLAGPADTTESISINIQQQYAKINGYWFPEQLNSYFVMRGVNLNGYNMTGTSRSYIRNVTVDPPLRRADFGPVVLRMEPRAVSVDDSLWDVLRQNPLNEREARTYTFMDSLGKAENFDRRIKMFSALATGAIRAGWVNIELGRILRYNRFEGLRLGAGLRTNDNLSQRFSIGGYYGYGLNDEVHKFGTDLQVNIHRVRDMYIRIAYSDDVRETGDLQLESGPSGIFSSNYYPLLVNRMDRVRNTEISFNGRVWGNLSTTLVAARQEINPYRDAGYLVFQSEQTRLILRDFIMSQAGLRLRWAPGEKLAATGLREVALGSRWPVFHARIIRGKVDYLKGDEALNHRLDLMVEKTFRTALYGNISLRVAAGAVEANVPSSLFYNARGSNTLDYSGKSYFGIAAPYTFETMRVNEFLHNRYALLHLRYSLRDLLFRSGRFKPMLTLVQNILFGTLDEAEKQLLTARTAERGFLESGLYIDRMVSSGFSAIGLGVFYRYGTYAFDDSLDNLAVKLSLSFEL